MKIRKCFVKLKKDIELSPFQGVCVWGGGVIFTRFTRNILAMEKQASSGCNVVFETNFRKQFAYIGKICFWNSRVVPQFSRKEPKKHILWTIHE